MSTAMAEVVRMLPCGLPRMRPGRAGGRCGHLWSCVKIMFVQLLHEAFLPSCILLFQVVLNSAHRVAHLHQEAITRQGLFVTVMSHFGRCCFMFSGRQRYSANEPKSCPLYPCLMSTSLSWSTSGGPYCVQTIAFIWVSFLLDTAGEFKNNARSDLWFATFQA